jgi:hypothetical protein
VKLARGDARVEPIGLDLAAGAPLRGVERRSIARLIRYDEAARARLVEEATRALPGGPVKLYRYLDANRDRRTGVVGAPATLGYLAFRFQVSTRTITRWIAVLTREGLVERLAPGRIVEGRRFRAVYRVTLGLHTKAQVIPIDTSDHLLENRARLTSVLETREVLHRPKDQNSHLRQDGWVPDEEYGPPDPPPPEVIRKAHEARRRRRR